MLLPGCLFAGEHMHTHTVIHTHVHARMHVPYACAYTHAHTLTLAPCGTLRYMLSATRLPSLLLPLLPQMPFTHAGPAVPPPPSMCL